MGFKEINFMIECDIYDFLQLKNRKPGMRRRTIFLKNELPAEAFPNRILFLYWKTTKHSPHKASPIQASLRCDHLVSWFKITTPQGTGLLQTPPAMAIGFSPTKKQFQSLRNQHDMSFFNKKNRLDRCVSKGTLRIKAKSFLFWNSPSPPYPQS